MTEIRDKLPHNFVLRTYQKPVVDALNEGRKRAVCVWHRRSGKDKTFINYMVASMAKRVGAYFYLFPTYAQGKKILWDGRDRAGFKFTDHIPKDLRKATNKQEMKIEMKNGSIFQVVGTDKIDSIVGSNPLGCVFSEYALQDPTAWDYLRPILAENAGWAIFNFTPRGKNHGYTLFKAAQGDPDIWFAEVLTVDDTGAIPREVLEQERKEIIAQYGTDALYQQEYMCSFEVPIQGSYYGQQLMDADAQKRIANVPYDPAARVCTTWDLGIGDEMAIWFIQAVGQEIRVIDYYESSGEGLAHYVKTLQNKPYVYDEHFAPHDIKVRELSTGKSRLEAAKSLGIDFTVAPMLRVEDGIEAVRSILARCWFDKLKCEKGLSALRSYHKEFDEKNQVFRLRPHHDWASHGCLAGDSLVLTDGGNKRIDQIKVGEMVWTPAGCQKVLNAGMTKVSEVLEIETTLGVIKATPEHKFFTNRGIARADALRYNDQVWTKNLGKSLLEGSFTNFREDIMSLHRAQEENSRTYIGRFGRTTMGTSQKVITYITRMVTRLITGSRISNVYLNIRTYLWRQGVMSGLVRKQINSSYGKRENFQRNGTAHLKEGRGTVGTVGERGKIENGKRSFVSFVQNPSKLRSLLEQNTVAKVVRVSPATSEPVYDLTVNKHHCYLANGLLVSNSDAFRTFAVSYRKKVKSVRTPVRVPQDDPYR